MQNGLLEEEQKDVPECSQGGVAVEPAHTDYTTLQERTTLNPAQPYKQAYITRDEQRMVGLSSAHVVRPTSIKNHISSSTSAYRKLW